MLTALKLAGRHQSSDLVIISFEQQASRYASREAIDRVRLKVWESLSGTLYYQVGAQIQWEITENAYADPHL